jgi:DNA-directed RNA polymerase specialized sigma24 family protein
VGLDNYREFYNDDILRAIDSLSPIYREALLLQQAGYKLEEIMEIVHRNGSLKNPNLETVKSRLFLAKLKMRQMIDRDGNSKDE